MLAEVHFPSMENMVVWPDFLFKDTNFAFNKVALLSLFAMAIPTVWFLLAGAKAKKGAVPGGAYGVAFTLLAIPQSLGHFLRQLGFAA